jgi:hypothetical protein
MTGCGTGNRLGHRNWASVPLLVSSFQTKI